MTRTIEIDKITVHISHHGTDQIDFKTNRPSPFPAGVDSTPLTLTARVPRLTGIKYVQKTFGFAPDVIDTRTLEERKREDEARRKQSDILRR